MNNLFTKIKKLKEEELLLSKKLDNLSNLEDSYDNPEEFAYEFNKLESELLDVQEYIEQLKEDNKLNNLYKKSKEELEEEYNILEERLLDLESNSLLHLDFESKKDSLFKKLELIDSLLN